jgi:alpha-L-rhamnosidase
MASANSRQQRRPHACRRIPIITVLLACIVLGLHNIFQFHWQASHNNENDQESFGILLALRQGMIPAAAVERLLPVQQQQQQRLHLSSDNPAAALVPFDLSVNQLQVIDYWNGGLPKDSVPATAEDFLPIVLKDDIHLRFRLRGRPGASHQAIADISAYQIIAHQAHSSSSLNIIWDSGKVQVASMPRSIPWGGPTLKIGSIIQWNVLVWDLDGVGPAISSVPSKFGVGPSQDKDWTAQWITHPTDLATLQGTSRDLEHTVSDKDCRRWKKRLSLPLARAQFFISKEQHDANNDSPIVSALLVVGGLGSFRATLNGRPLSSSSILDPPLTDYAQRVSYRGFDITQSLLLRKSGANHVLGISLGAGYWDHRPLNGDLVHFGLLPRGPLTAIAEIHCTHQDGSVTVVVPSNNNNNNKNGTDDGVWQMAKGPIQESNIFTGETIDLGFWKDIQGWDSPRTGNDKGGTSSLSWVTPALYQSDMTPKTWRHAIQAFAVDRVKEKVSNVAPIGKLVPMESPPVLPIHRIAPESTIDLGKGRWLLDFGKAMSGVLRFENGLPTPMTKQRSQDYPRGHFLPSMAPGEYITVVYGDSLEMETGDINLVLTAGMGLHNGGPRGTLSKPNDTDARAGPCFPPEDGKILTQRDVFFLSSSNSTTSAKAKAKGLGGSFADARQPHFVYHGFRFAEVCCTELPPTQVYAIQYRSAFAEWGSFDSSNVVLNGAYEMTKNAFDSNMLGIQSDCPHRERLQYGGDIVSSSNSAMHFYDLSAFYAKVVTDFTDAQYDNGAYTVTSLFQDILSDRAIARKGSGETIWASVAPVLSVRHMNHYGDTKFLERFFNHHVNWLKFLNENWKEGIRAAYGKYGTDLASYDGGGDAGLGDWLGIDEKDTWLTHHAYYMASARSVAYVAQKLADSDAQNWMNESVSSMGNAALDKANKIKDTVVKAYMKDDGTFRHKKGAVMSPGPEMGLFARMVDGEKRCDVLESWLQHIGSGDLRIWPGDEEKLFHKHLAKPEFNEMIDAKLMTAEGEVMRTNRRNTHEGIFSLRFTLKALSDMGFHNIALSKASGIDMPSFGYMLSFNATTLWETWWRSEDMFSRNHPMYGAVAEWLSSSVAGVGLAPTTVGGEELLFWPRIPTSTSTLKYASATQGTKRGEASIAWKFLSLPDHDDDYDAEVMVHIRILVPPASKATLRLSLNDPQAAATILHTETLPNLRIAKSRAEATCLQRREARQGFPFNWEYSADKKEWSKVHRGKAIGTPCESYLFGDIINAASWSPPLNLSGPYISRKHHELLETLLQPGLYDIIIPHWKLEKEIPDKPGYSDYKGSMGPYCSDPTTFDWDVNDAEHII